MTDRISTSQMYSQSVSLMLSKQSRINHLEQQLATGSKLVSAKDDPIAAGSAVGLDRAVAALEQLGKNASSVQNRLGLQENVLTEVGDMMARITELTVQASNPALSSADRNSMAAELSTLKDRLVALGNSTDGTGRYLFGGASDDNPPFTVAGGVVSYSGDQVQRQVEVAPGMLVSDAQAGSEIFMRIRTGDGVVDGAAAAGNTGKGLLTNITRDGTGTYDGSAYRIAFTAPDAYEIRDADDNVVATGSFAAGEDIVFGGLRLTIEGTPAAGDAFSAGASTTRDIFSTVQGLIDGLKMDTTQPQARILQQNLLQAGARDIARASEQMIDARAAGGAQLITLEESAAMRESNAVTLKTTLSGLRDLDYAQAIGDYRMETTALQAAQTVFSQMQSMSLFNTLR